MITAIAKRAYVFKCPYCKKTHSVNLDFFRSTEGHRDYTCKECNQQFMLDDSAQCRVVGGSW